MTPIKEVERVKVGYNPATGSYKTTRSEVGERIDPIRLASLRPIKRFSGQFKTGGKMSDPTLHGEFSRFSSIKYEKGGAFMRGVESAVPYMSNVANAFRRLPMPKAAPTETPINPNLVNYDAARGAVDQDYQSFAGETDYKVPNAGVAQAVKATGLAKKIAAKNALSQQEENTNAFIKNQTNQTNQSIIARNIERQRDYNDQVLSRGINQQRLASENFADVADKFLMGKRDKAMIDLEGRKLNLEREKYKDTGVWGRNLSEGEMASYRSLYPELTDEEIRTRFGIQTKRKTIAPENTIADPAGSVRYGGKIKRC